MKYLEVDHAIKAVRNVPVTLLKLTIIVSTIVTGTAITKLTRLTPWAAYPTAFLGTVFVTQNVEQRKYRNSFGGVEWIKGKVPTYRLEVDTEKMTAKVSFPFMGEVGYIQEVYQPKNKGELQQALTNPELYKNMTAEVANELGAEVMNNGLLNLIPDDDSNLFDNSMEAKVRRGCLYMALGLK